LWVDQAAKPKTTLIREIQRDVITDSLLHVDLYEVVMSQRITAEIPLSFVGEAPIVAQKTALLVRRLDSVQVQCLPNELVGSIEVDLTVLTEEDHAILVKELFVDPTIEILTNPEDVVVQVLPVKEEVVEEIVEEEVEALEVEVITAAKEREEEPKEEFKEPEEEGEGQEAEAG